MQFVIVNLNMKALRSIDLYCVVCKEHFEVRCAYYLLCNSFMCQEKCYIFKF